MHFEAYESSRVSFRFLQVELRRLCGRDKRRSVAVEQTLCSVQACPVQKRRWETNRQPDSLDAEPINVLFCFVLLSLLLLLQKQREDVVAGRIACDWVGGRKTSEGQLASGDRSVTIYRIDNWRVDDTYRLAERLAKQLGPLEGWTGWRDKPALRYKSRRRQFVF